MNKKNEIVGGVRGGELYVFFDGKDIYEVPDTVGNSGFGRSMDFCWFGVNDMWMNKEEEEELRQTFPTMSEEAIRAIRDANIRGVYVNVVYYDDSKKNLFMNLIQLRNAIHSIQIFEPKLFEKMNKVLRKHGEDDINLDDCFKK